MKKAVESMNKSAVIVVWTLLISGVSFLVSIVIIERLPSYTVNAQENLKNVSQTVKEHIKADDNLELNDRVSSRMSGNTLIVEIGKDTLEGISLGKGVEINVDGTVESYSINVTKEPPEKVSLFDRLKGDS